MKPQEVVKTALAARRAAYAPYSGYKVGAALLTEDGVLYTGCNVENASYGLTICAERTAIFKAVSEGARRFVAMAVATADGGAPCGACRQVLAEFGADIELWIADRRGKFSVTSVRDLLPQAFTGGALRSKPKRTTKRGT